MSIMAEVKLEADHGLGAVRTMPQFRQAAEQSALTAADRQLLLDQAALLIDTVYVHLLHKRAMYAIEPSQRLRLLRHRLARLTDAQFHAELLRIFIELRDLHTNYVLPRPYQGPFAFLGVLLEQFWRDGKPGFLVSKTFPHLTGDPQLVDGAEITHWNGAPIALAVARNADREAGSNADARLARGCESMSLRTLALSAVPDEDWVDLRYLVDGTAHETRLHWRVFDTSADLNGPLPDAGPFAGLTVPSAHLVGLDLRTEVVRQAKKQLFVLAAVDEERRVAEQAGDVPEPTAEQLAAGEIPTTRPDELRARVVTTPAGTFGHLRIFTFHMRDQGIEAFLNEVIRLLDALPKNGLILDVRGNGGGYVVAAEFLLQFLTPRRIQPEPMQLISTDATRQLCASVDDLADWRASVDQAIETGAQYSSAVPLYPADVVNSVGQVYHGPVVLITDALCYSATDIFSARLPGPRDRHGARHRRGNRRRRRERVDPAEPRGRLAERPVPAAARERAVPGGAAALPARRQARGRAGGGPRGTPGRAAPDDPPGPAGGQRRPAGEGGHDPGRRHAAAPRRGRGAAHPGRRGALADHRGADQRRRVREPAAGEVGPAHRRQADAPGAAARRRPGGDPAGGLRRRHPGRGPHAGGERLTAQVRTASCRGSTVSTRVMWSRNSAM
nr:hypothetical protein GCM10020092_046540 [Actinoplanes digitatis]